MKAQNFEHDVFKTPGGDMITITFIRHASLVIEWRDKTIYVDPVSEYADFSKMAPADLILITHEHHDHFDTKAIEALGAKAQIILNPATQKMLGRGQAIAQGEAMDLPAFGMKIEAVPAYNNTPGRDKFHPAGRDNGYILTMDGERIYIAGDTEDIPEMKDIKDIDIAFLPVNQPYPMTPEQAARAARTVSPGILYPYHYGETDIRQLEKLLKDSGIDLRIRQLQ